MAKNESLFYKTKEEHLIIKYRELCNILPPYAKNFLQSKELITKYSTLVAYAYDLITFFEFLKRVNPSVKNLSIKEIPAELLDQLTEDDILEYQRYLRLSVNETESKANKIQNDNKAIARKMTPVRGLFDSLVRKQYIKSNVAKMVPMPKIKEPKIIKRLDNDSDNNEIVKLLSGIDDLKSLSITEKQRKFLEKTWYRDKAILNLFLGTGIRVSECQGLDISDIEFDMRYLNIKRKGGFYDRVYFNETVKQHLVEYLEHEHDHYLSDDTLPEDKNALFLSNKGKRMSVDALEHLVEKYTLMILGKSFSPHKLRATYGTVLYQKTGDIRLTADVLGHTSVTTTSKHYAAQTEQNKRKAGDLDFTS
ncbi:MAG: tyrosine-type recombinase/integrase [Lachnospiraceae bacterium]|nr:tyrosine-type recombinase/integrase [Lachnospiraceae bacterium]